MNKKLLLLLASLTIIASGTFAAVAQTHRTKIIVKPPIIRAKKPPVLSAGAVKTPSGLIYLITQKGTGRLPKAGETVSVHYTGTLTNGIKFDSSRDRGRPYEFPLGKGQVIKGWDEGIAKLHIGDQAVLVVPGSLGYGAGGRGMIPPNATMIFIVELVDIKTDQP